jgi:hypothetical protein
VNFIAFNPGINKSCSCGTKFSWLSVLHANTNFIHVKLGLVEVLVLPKVVQPVVLAAKGVDSSGASPAAAVAT